MVKNIPSGSSLVKKKTECDTKISELEKKLTDYDHDKYITTSELNTFATKFVNTKITQANLAILHANNLNNLNTTNIVSKG